MAWSILIPLFWSVTTIVSTRQLAATAAAPVRVQKKPAKLPATGKKPKKLDAQMKRSCLEQLYELPTTHPTLEKEGKREKIRAICRSCGLNEQYMQAELKRLPSGLVNTTQQLTLRRAVNKLCGIKGDRQRWTQAELKEAVLNKDTVGFNATCTQYDLTKSTLDKHCKALVKHKAGGGCVDSYFAQDLTAGRPRLITRDHEAMCAAIFDLHGVTGIGKDYQRAKKYLGGLATATHKEKGTVVTGSQSLVRGFKRRNQMSAQKASDLSQIRAQSLTPEKHHRVCLPSARYGIAYAQTELLLLLCGTTVCCSCRCSTSTGPS